MKSGKVQVGRQAFTYKVVRRQVERSARSIIRVFAQDFDAATKGDRQTRMRRGDSAGLNYKTNLTGERGSGGEKGAR